MTVCQLATATVSIDRARRSASGGRIAVPWSAYSVAHVDTPRRRVGRRVRESPSCSLSVPDMGMKHVGRLVAGLVMRGSHTASRPFAVNAMCELQMELEACGKLLRKLMDGASHSR